MMGRDPTGRGPELPPMDWAQGRVIAKLVAQQCSFWDGGTQQVTNPCARLFLAVIEQALIEIPNRFQLAPDPGAYKDDNRFRTACYEWASRKADARDAWDFIMSDRVEGFTDLLGIEANWLRRMVKKWMTLAPKT